MEIKEGLVLDQEEMEELSFGVSLEMRRNGWVRAEIIAFDRGEHGFGCDGYVLIQVAGADGLVAITNGDPVWQADTDPEDWVASFGE